MAESSLVNKLFTVNSLNKLVFEHDTRTFSQAIQEIGGAMVGQTNLDAIRHLYAYMSKKHRNEYFYKNALLNKILLGRHSMNTTSALRELPVAGNILDFLIINGVGQVYEIKTELDNLKRLRQQVSTYYQAFSFCNVVTDESHLAEVRKILDFPQVGIILLTKRNTLHVVRNSEMYNEGLKHETLFKLLRKPEFERVLLRCCGQLPQTSQGRYYRACLAQFKGLDILEAQGAVLRELKQRAAENKKYAEPFARVPVELKELVYFSGYRQADFAELEDFLVQQVGEA